jgi:hypothetical protein
MMFWMIFATAVSSSAHVPEWSTIASRAADQHGRGAYLIEQDVSIRKDNEIYVVKETWSVLNENTMRLVIEGRGGLHGLAQGVIIYDGNLRTAADQGQAARSARLGDEWLEPLFHFRFSKWFRNRVVALKIAPPESLEDRAALKAEGDPGYTRPGFLRLSRAGGSIAYAVGIPPEVSVNAPTLWIEQDEFVVRKYRSANQVTIHADDYAKESGLKLPRRRTYNFGSYEVQTQVTSVKPLGKLTGTDGRFSKAALNPARDGVRLPEIDGLREFYSRFR